MKKNLFSPKWKFLLYISSIILIIAILLIIVPITIDHLYLLGKTSTNPVLTNYSAPDVLIFWGSILSVTSTTLLALVAYKQNRNLSDINNRIMTQQVKPVVVCEYDTNWKNDSAVCRIFSQDGEHIINNGWSLQQPNLSNWCALKIRNIGLGPAININTFIHKLVHVQNLEKLSDISLTPIEQFYEKIKYENYSYMENGNIREDKWQIYPTFNLGISKESNSLCLVFFADRTIENMYNILEIIYQDAFGSEYKQFLYFSFIDGVPSFLPISQPI